MRHAVSPNQLVLWPHHALNPAWAPAGIVSVPKQGATDMPGDHTGEARKDELHRGFAPAAKRPATSALTYANGVCAQARPGRRAPRAARTVRRGAGLTDLA